MKDVIEIPNILDDSFNVSFDREHDEFLLEWENADTIQRLRLTMVETAIIAEQFVKTCCMKVQEV